MAERDDAILHSQLKGDVLFEEPGECFVSAISACGADGETADQDRSFLRVADALQHNVKPEVTQQACCREFAHGPFRGESSWHPYLALHTVVARNTLSGFRTCLHRNLPALEWRLQGGFAFGFPVRGHDADRTGDTRISIKAVCGSIAVCFPIPPLICHFVSIDSYLRPGFLSGWPQCFSSSIGGLSGAATRKHPRK